MYYTFSEISTLEENDAIRLWTLETALFGFLAEIRQGAVGDFAIDRDEVCTFLEDVFPITAEVAHKAFLETALGMESIIQAETFGNEMLKGNAVSLRLDADRLAAAVNIFPALRAFVDRREGANEQAGSKRANGEMGSLRQDKHRQRGNKI